MIGDDSGCGGVSSIPSTMGLQERFCYKGWEFLLMFLCLNCLSVLALVESFRYHYFLREGVSLGNM